MTLQYNQIIVAVDGSKESEWAFKKSVAIAGRNNATLNLVNIIDTRSYAAVEAYDRSIAERAQSFATELLEEYRLKALATGSTKCKYTRRIRFSKNDDFKRLSKKGSSRSNYLWRDRAKCS